MRTGGDAAALHDEQEFAQFHDITHRGEMNVMRKLRGSGASTPSTASTDAVMPAVNLNHREPGRSIDIFSSLRGDDLESYLIAEHDNITMEDKRSYNHNLHTLKQLFHEYTRPVTPLSDQERDSKLYEMLPLFCKVFLSNFFNFPENF